MDSEGTVEDVAESSGKVVEGSLSVISLSETVDSIVLLSERVEVVSSVFEQLIAVNDSHLY